ncbi:ATP-dependent helicase hrq1 [Hondaea fermentalgiana]|uniref:ATP-dependent helicase hrq1 n=1 Tax=Hondaea fermentalgiana TaxID=2315210 RepID=A0A2R5H058_9STRA|nr:ATP-dependent helicase hrq1 [Hondaea fermentalgiana]|eukprot:GBG34433.1 ATP-dependent helicase hrq1 [Hondaea fermentalgiana]
MAGVEAESAGHGGAEGTAASAAAQTKEQVLRECKVLDAAVSFLTKKHISCRVPVTINMVKSLSRASVDLTLDRIRQLIHLAPEVLCLQYVPVEASAGNPTTMAQQQTPEPPLAFKVDHIVYHLEIIVKKRYVGAGKTALKKRTKAYETGVAACNPSSLEMEPLPPAPLLSAPPSSTENGSSAAPIVGPIHQDLAALYRSPDSQYGLDFEGIVRFLKDCPFYETQLEYTQLYPRREQQFADLAHPLHVAIAESLALDFGIEKFFKHQALAIDAARRGCNIVVSTSTSSGKSLVFGIPVFDTLLKEGNLLSLKEAENGSASKEEGTIKAEDASENPNGNNVKSAGFLEDNTDSGGFCASDEKVNSLNNEGKRAKVKQEREEVEASEEDELPDRAREVTALYIFPTKALAQDQLGSTRRLASAIGARASKRVRVCTYDGDTKQSDREDIRKDAEIIITNPDMLHVTILPQHRHWKNFLRGLRFVIIDEAHAYHGIFGSHVACVLRRLQRVCAMYAVRPPQFFTCSATIANPVELFSLLCPSSPNELFAVGDDMDGSPCGRRLFGIWNPPLHPSQRFAENAKKEANDAKTTKKGKVKNEKKTKKANQKLSDDGNAQGQPDALVVDAKEESMLDRKSSIYETALLLSALTRLGVKTMAFCRTRKLTELVLRYTQDELKQGYKGKVYESQDKTRDLAPTFAQGQPHLADLVAGYRGGYQAAERRVIEDKLFNGRLIAVTATNALELGIDVGHLDAVILLGYPGSAASMWQQVGRAGRSGKDALALFVCFNGPTDQYFAQRPNELLDRGRVERAVLDPFNKYVIKDHLLCAMHERAFHGEEDRRLFGGTHEKNQETLTQVLSDLVEDNLAIRLPHGALQTHAKLCKPWNNVSLRVVDPVTFELYSGGELMDTIPYSRALFELYPGAIYMHQGRSFLVSKMDLNSYKAWAHPTHVNYYTSPRDCNYVKVMGRFDTERLLPGLDVHCGAVQIERSVWGYRKIWLRSGRIFEMHEFTLPSLFFETQAAWVDLSTEVQITVAQAGRDVRAGIHGINHMLAKLVQVHIMCHSSNVGIEHDAEFIKRPRPPRLMIFDDCPGGLGIAEAAYLKMLPMLQSCRDMVANCSCRSASGCLACLAHATCGEYNARLDKRAALIILDMILGPKQEPPRPPEAPRTPRANEIASAATAGSPRRLRSKRKKAPTTPERNRAKSLPKALSMGRARVEQVQIQRQWVAQQPSYSENISKDE